MMQFASTKKKAVVPSQSLEKVTKVKCAEKELTHIDLDKISNLDDLKQYDLDTLKHSLRSRGLKCGGTANERRERLFGVKGLQPENYPRKWLARR